MPQTSSTPPRHALISVSDKRGLLPLARALHAAGYVLLSTGGTARALRDAHLDVTDVSSLTQYPELFDGRVKTLHPRIHGGLLADPDDPEHQRQRESHGVPLISLLVVNLYPFAEAIASPSTTLKQAIAQIDIGGPAMLRAAAKNFAHVLPICDPDEYPWLIEHLDALIPLARRRALAARAFAHTARYDALVSQYLDEPSTPQDLPETLHASHTRSMTLRYGENPHQRGALYHSPPMSSLGGFAQHHGKALSYNNIIDLDAALSLVQEFELPTCAIIKHTNPAGCASASDLVTSYERALASDPLSAFGGIVALNRPIEAELAALLHDHFFEVIAAPSFSGDALEILQRKKNLRLLSTPARFFDASCTPDAISWRFTALGWLAQSADPRITLDLSTCEVPTARHPTAEELEQLTHAWRVVKHVKSNAIVCTRSWTTVGIGAGQMSRVDAVKLARARARSSLQGAVLASDAFFPFEDGPEAAFEAGITAIVQPGGSVRDAQVIAACDARNVAMVFTRMRHFRH